MYRRTQKIRMNVYLYCMIYCCYSPYKVWLPCGVMSSEQGEHRECPTIPDEHRIFLHKTLVDTVDDEIACESENYCCDLTDL